MSGRRHADRPAPATHLCALVCEVWVPAKLPPLLHVAMRHLRQGGRRVAVAGGGGGGGRGSWQAAAGGGGTTPCGAELPLNCAPGGGRARRTSILRALGQRARPSARLGPFMTGGRT